MLICLVSTLHPHAIAGQAADMFPARRVEVLVCSCHHMPFQQQTYERPATALPGTAPPAAVGLSKKWLCRLSGRFVKPLWYEPLRDGKDNLPGMHANTHLAQARPLGLCGMSLKACCSWACWQWAEEPQLGSACPVVCALGVWLP